MMLVFFNRKTDFENYLACLLLPSNLQATGFAIRAFNSELAQIKDITSDKLIAHMRFQFWKDTIDKIYTESPPPASPIAQELFRAVKRNPISKMWFKRLIDARLDTLHGKPFPTVDAVDSYAENSVSPIAYILLEAQSIKNVQADHAASHVGKAIGLTTVIRSVPFLVSRGQVNMPMDLLMKYNLSTETVSRIARGNWVMEILSFHFLWVYRPCVWLIAWFTNSLLSWLIVHTLLDWIVGCIFKVFLTQFF